MRWILIMKEIKQQADSQKPKPNEEKARIFLDNEAEKTTSNSGHSGVETSQNATGQISKNTEGVVTDSQKPKPNEEKNEIFLDNENEKHTSNPDCSGVETSRNITSHKRNNTAGVVKKIKSTVSIFLNILQTLGLIATVAMAFLAWRTLIEMQTERNNAYQPEIVITPNVFEGKIMEKLEDRKDIEYLFFDITNLYPPGSIFRSSHAEGKDVFLEKPYLTLKNIGKGTAKDVQVEYPIEWEQSALKILNDNIPDDNNKDDNKDNEVEAYYMNWPASSDGSEPLGKNTQSITYIESGGDSIHVKLPDKWYHLLQLLFNQKYRLSEKKEPGGLINPINPITHYEYLEIPDLIITIHYLDIQGKSYEQTITIPWDGYYSYMVYPASVEKDENLTLVTRFYGDYLR